jgi:hypothetical protein
VATDGHACPLVRGAQAWGSTAELKRGVNAQQRSTHPVNLALAPLHLTV